MHVYNSLQVRLSRVSCVVFRGKLPSPAKLFDSCKVKASMLRGCDLEKSTDSYDDVEKWTVRSLSGVCKQRVCRLRCTFDKADRNAIDTLAELDD